MKIKDMPFPNFKNPPVVEVVFSVQFKPLDKFRIPHLGLLYSIFREKGFVEFQEREPLNSQVELFSENKTTNFTIRLTQKIPVPRCWFISENKEKMIQIQQDRFVFNWRKQIEQYPRYISNLSEFEIMFDEFSNFIKTENLGEIEHEQCEIQYVNHIDDSNNADLTKIFEFYKIPTEKINIIDDLLKPERIHSYMTYVLHDDKNKPCARLHITVEPGRKQNKTIFILNLIVRGKPEGNGKENLINFFNFGREWIVKSFVSITKDEIQKSNWEIEE